MSIIVDIVNNTLDEWNTNVVKLGNNFHYEIEYGIRMKKFYINKNDFLEEEIIELSLYQKADDRSEKDFLLWRKEMPIPKKQKHESKIARERLFTDIVYRCLIYEMLGNFCIATKQLILNRDYAEYDIENDRLKQDESAVGMVVRVQTNGPFFEPGNEFDVFMDTEGEYYAVYTQHEIGKANNGIARIPKKDCIIAVAAKKQIILL